eukprot:422419-Pleurochrysis_carterae.AAC.1
MDSVEHEFPAASYGTRTGVCERPTRSCRRPIDAQTRICTRGTVHAACHSIRDASMCKDSVILPLVNMGDALVYMEDPP